MARTGNSFLRMRDAKDAIMAISRIIFTRDIHTSMDEAGEVEMIEKGEIEYKKNYKMVKFDSLRMSDCDYYYLW